MKALFLVFHGFQAYNGISKKISYQVDALRKCGIDTRICHYEVMENGHCQWMVDEQFLADLGTGLTAKLKKRVSFSPILHYAEQEHLSFVYVRSYHNANPFTIRLMKGMKKLGIKVLLEIPTYPYDREYTTFLGKIQLYTDKLFRRTLCNYVDAIVTFSDRTEIFGCPTLRISNGIDFDSLPLRKTVRPTHRELHLIGVAEIHYWHGFDRLIKGLADYYSHLPSCKVYFHIVGLPSGEREQREIESPIREYNLNPYVILHGAKHGKELDALFEQADFAIGSLARHRSGIYRIKTLKNREYAARGFSFIYSENDDDFDAMPYVLKAPADESPINIKRIADFCQNLPMKPQEIRDSIRHLSWETQMKKVVENIP